MKKLARLSFLIFIALVIPTSTTLAANWNPFVTWHREKSDRHIKVFKCGLGLGFKIVKDPRTPQHVGRIIACNAKKIKANTWEGEVLSVDDENIYRGKVTMPGPNRLQLKGCVLFGIICITEEWKKVGK